MSRDSRNTIDLETRKRFVRELRSHLRVHGKSIQSAAKEIGVSRGTISRWFKREDAHSISRQAMMQTIRHLNLSSPYVLGKLPRGSNLISDISVIARLVNAHAILKMEKATLAETMGAVEMTAVAMSRLLYVISIPNRLIVNRRTSTGIQVGIYIEDPDIFSAAIAVEFFDGSEGLEYEMTAYNAVSKAVKPEVISTLASGQFSPAAARDIAKWLLRISFHARRSQSVATVESFNACVRSAHKSHYEKIMK